MKFKLKNIVALAAIALAITSCTKDNVSNSSASATGKMTVEIDPTYKDAPLSTTTPYTNSNGEVLLISTAKFIVSNIVLTKADGSVYTVPKSDSYFIVDEFAPVNTRIILSNIPVGTYTKIKYGIGVDKQQYDMGANGQGDFLATAQNQHMLWSWSAGYRFLVFEGTYTKPGTVDTDTPFGVHIGMTGTDYNYTDVTLNMPQNATVTTTAMPKINIKGDLSQIVDGTNKINFTDGADITGGTKLPLIVANFSNMFTVTNVINN